jgi:hypothetical protein
VTGEAPVVSGETGVESHLTGYDQLKQLFDRVIRTRHALLSHLRTHTSGQTCATCGQVTTDDRLAQAAYESAWRELFAGASPRAGNP